MGFGNARRFDPAKETVGGKTDDDSVLDELTPEVVARHMAERCASDLIVDAFAGVGGNAIQVELHARGPST